MPNTTVGTCCCSACSGCSDGCGSALWTWQDTGGGEGIWNLTTNSCSCGWPLTPTTVGSHDGETTTKCCSTNPCDKCPLFLDTLYITYSCAPNCSCQNGTQAFSGPFGDGVGGYVWFNGLNPCFCDSSDVISCRDGVWNFSSCFGSGYPSPPGITVTFVSMNPLLIEVGSWTHQGTGNCNPDGPDQSVCTAVITQ